MHKDKKKLLLVGFIFIIFLIVVIIIISLITSYVKNKDNKLQESDPYPIEFAYMGVLYDSQNGYEIIVPLDNDFNKSEISANSFYNIKDIKSFNNKVMVYSDALNEVAYSNADSRLYLEEINSFYDANSVVKLANDYIVLVANGSIQYIRKTDNDAEKEEIEKGLEEQSIAVINNKVYYRNSGGIVCFDIDNKSTTLIIPTNNDNSLNIVDYNDEYILLESNNEYSIYDLEKKELFSLKGLINDDITKILSLYSNGFIYEKNNPYELVSYSLFFKRNEDAIFKMPDGFVVNNMYHISGNLCFVDMIRDNEHKYYIYDARNKDFVKELNEDYKYIVKVK